MPRRLLLIIVACLTGAGVAQADSKCLHIMSYHKGYEWNDGIEEGVERTLSGKCELRKFYMDSKRNTSPDYIQKMALKGRALIEQYKPDVVIVSDDNASRYLVKPYYKNAQLPFVFNGINWTAEEYGYPYKNVTGMVEVVPIRTMLQIARRNLESVRKVVFLSADVLTEHKDFKHYQRIYIREGIDVEAIFVKTMDEWERAFSSAQSADLVILGNNAGINDWVRTRAERHVYSEGKAMTLTTYKWMMPYSAVGVSKLASEQGEWAAEVALNILKGIDVSQIPITINRRSIIYTNKTLLKKYGISIDEITLTKAISKDW